VLLGGHVGEGASIKGGGKLKHTERLNRISSTAQVGPGDVDERRGRLRARKGNGAFCIKTLTKTAKKAGGRRPKNNQ